MVDVQVYVLNHINASCFCHILSDQISLAETSQVILSKVKGEEVYSSHESVGERVTNSENNLIYPATPDSIHSYCTPTPCISEMLLGDALWGRRRKGEMGLPCPSASGGKTTSVLTFCFQFPCSYLILSCCCVNGHVTSPPKFRKLHDGN